MEDRLIELLESFGFDVFRQGSLAEEEPYPDSFFTYWDNDSNDANYYDNKAINTIYDYDINFYSTSPAKAFKKLKEAIELLKSEGFIISGDGYGVVSDEESHTGRGFNAIYMIERE